jgi:hypothetical protein
MLTIGLYVLILIAAIILGGVAASFTDFRWHPGNPLGKAQHDLQNAMQQVSAIVASANAKLTRSDSSGSFGFGRSSKWL